MYTGPEMEIIRFEDDNVFAGMDWASDGEEGEDQYSIRPERSDS